MRTFLLVVVAGAILRFPIPAQTSLPASSDAPARATSDHGQGDSNRVFIGAYLGGVFAKRFWDTDSPFISGFDSAPTRSYLAGVEMGFGHRVLFTPAFEFSTVPGFKSVTSSYSEIRDATRMFTETMDAQYRVAKWGYLGGGVGVTECKCIAETEFYDYFGTNGEPYAGGNTTTFATKTGPVIEAVVRFNNFNTSKRLHIGAKVALRYIQPTNTIGLFVTAAIGRQFR